jgi:hypothetical protein
VSFHSTAAITERVYVQAFDRHRTDDVVRAALESAMNLPVRL